MTEVEKLTREFLQEISPRERERLALLAPAIREQATEQKREAARQAAIRSKIRVSKKIYPLPNRRLRNNARK